MLPQGAGDDQPAWRGQLRERGTVRSDIGERRIAEGNVRTHRPGEEGQGVRADDGRAVGEAGRLEVLPQRRDRPRRLLDERRARSAARQRLDPQGPGAGEQVEDQRVGELRLEDPEQRFADPVGRRAGCPALGHDEPAALGLAGDHPHLRERVPAPERLDRGRQPGVLGSLQRWVGREDGIGVLGRLARQAWIDIL